MPFMERHEPGPAKRAIILNNTKKSKRAKIHRKVDGTNQRLIESDPPVMTDDSLDGVSIKKDPGITTVEEDMDDEDTNPKTDENLYEGDIDLNDSKGEGIMDESADELVENGDGSIERQEDVGLNGKEYVLAEIQEGKRRGSVNYLIQNKLFTKDYIYKTQVVASCTKQQAGMVARWL